MPKWLTPQTQSIRTRLLQLLALGLPCLWLVSAWFAYDKALDEINELFDTEQILFVELMASVASKVPHTNGVRLPPAAIPNVRGHAKRTGGDIEPSDYAYEMRDDSGRPWLTSQNPINIPYRPSYAGFANAEIGGQVWRVYYLQYPTQHLYLAVAQKLKERRSFAKDIVTAQMGVWLLSFPFLLMWVLFAIRKSLRPLAVVSKELAARDPFALSPLVQPVPEEIAPLVNTLNALLARLETQFDSERRFTGDAAHELRTPLAALRVQVEVAQMAGDETSRQRALGQLLHGIDRATRLVSQLLTLSRLDHASLAGRTACDLNALFRRTLDEAADRAVQRGVLIDIASTAPWLCQADPDVLCLLVNNLVNNALNYTLEGGRICLTAEAGRLVLENTAPTLAADSLVRLGERFYRPPGQSALGSGLGLSIARRAAGLSGLEIVWTSRNGLFSAQIGR